MLNIPEANPKMNLPIPKQGVNGIIAIQAPTIVTQSASIIAFLLPNVFKVPENKDPKNPPIKQTAVIIGINNPADEPHPSVAATQGWQEVNTPILYPIMKAPIPACNAVFHTLGELIEIFSIY